MSNESIYHYVYRITNIVENKHYYGKRTCKINPREDIGVAYFSSSTDKQFMKDQKVNPQNYKYKVVGVFKTAREAYILESALHNRFVVNLNASFYNKAIQTENGFNTAGMFAARCIETGTVEYISVNDPRYISGEMVAVSKGKLAGRSLTKEHKENIAAAKLAENNPNHKYYISTPLGIFNSLGEAARAHNTCATVISNRCNSPTRINYIKSTSLKEIEDLHKTNNASDESIEKLHRSSNKSTYTIISPNGDVLYCVNGHMRDFCVQHGFNFVKIREGTKSGMPLFSNIPDHPLHNCTVVRESGRSTQIQYRANTSSHKYYKIVTVAGTVYRFYATISLISEKLRCTHSSISAALRNKTPMFSGTNGKTYGKDTPHLINAICEECTSVEEIESNQWEELYRIVER